VTMLMSFGGRYSTTLHSILEKLFDIKSDFSSPTSIILFETLVFATLSAFGTADLARGTSISNVIRI